MARSPTTVTHLAGAIPARPAIYARISDDRNDDELGVKRQIRQCLALARRLGWPEPVVFEDNDLTAFKRKRRPGWEALARAIRAGVVDGLLGVHPDRFSRGDLRDLEDLIDLLNENDMAVETVNAGKYDLTTATGRMMARVVGSVARAESERMSEKISDKMVELAESGQHHGRTPYGYRKVGKTLEIVPDQAAVVREIVDRIVEGWALRRIATDLNRRGVPSPQGRTWHPPVVRAMVQRPSLIGWRDHKGVLVAKGDWPAILNEETWRQARTILSDPARKTTRPGRRYLLAGMIETIDGVRMNGNPRTHTGKPVYTGPRVSIDQEATDAEVLAQTWEHVARMSELPAPADDIAAAVRTEVATLEAELTELIRRRQAREIELMEYEAFAQPVRDRLAEVRKLPVGPRGPDLRAVASSPDGLRAQFEATDDLAMRRDILTGLIDRVVIHPGKPRARTVDLDRIEVYFR